MNIAYLSFHEISALIRTADANEVNHILSQMIPYVHFEDYDKIDQQKRREKWRRYKRNMVTIDRAYMM